MESSWNNAKVVAVHTRSEQRLRRRVQRLYSGLLSPCISPARQVRPAGGQAGRQDCVARQVLLVAVEARVRVRWHVIDLRLEDNRDDDAVDRDRLAEDDAARVIRRVSTSRGLADADHRQPCHVSRNLLSLMR